MSVSNSEDSYEDHDSESSSEQLNSENESDREHPAVGGGFSQFRDVVLSEPTKFLKSFPLTPKALVQHENLTPKTAKAKAAKLKSASGTPEYDAKFWLMILSKVGVELSLTPKEMLRCATTLLEDEAYQWWTSITSHLESEIVTWKFFKRKFRVNYFGAAYCMKKHYEFVNLRQGSMAPQEYISKFVHLSAYAPELVSTEALWCKRFVYGLEYEIYSAVVGFKDEVFSTLRDRVLRIDELCDHSKGPSDQEMLQPKRPVDADNNTESSKKAKKSRQSRKFGSCHPLQYDSSFQQQPFAPVTSTGGLASQYGVPVCDYCRRRHPGICWRKAGACLKCGSMDHIIRNCPRYRAVTSAYYRGALGVIVVYDITKRQSFDHVARWVEELCAHADSSTVIMLIGNKSDLVNHRAVPMEGVVEFAEAQGLFFSKTSTLSGHNVDNAFLRLLEEIYSGVSKKTLDGNNNVGGKLNGVGRGGTKIDVIARSELEISEMKKLSTCSCCT